MHFQIGNIVDSDMDIQEILATLVHSRRWTGDTERPITLQKSTN
jgi:hypothetical protein